MVQDMKFCFLILHYMVIDETVKCINSITDRFHNSNYRIVVVDNASPNKSGEELQRLYSDNACVDILLNDENSGFAKGNNYGYQYVVKKYNSDFIIIMNNDIEIEDDDFLEKIESIYEQEQFHILGPDIYSSTFETHQSPKRLSGYSYDEILQANKNYKSALDHKTRLKIKCILKRSFWLRKKKYQLQRSQIDYTKKYINVPLHGACLIFSKKYSERYENAFYPETFFYYECEILDYICRRDGLKTVYSPEIRIIHHQNVSTNVVYNNIYSKTLFSLKCNIESTEAFIELIKQSEGHSS